MRLLAFSFIAMFVANSASADGFLIGDVPLSIGDSEDVVRPQLEAKYQLIEIRPHIYEVVDKHDVDVHHGIVQFRDGKADWASRDVAAFDGDAVRKFGKAFVDVIATDMFGENAKVSVSIDTNPRYEVRTVTFEFPGRTVMLYVSNKGELTDVSIEEIILKDPTPAVASADKEKTP